MSELYQCLSHSKWDCKYHVVFVPKRRRKVRFGQTRRHLGPIFHALARQKEYGSFVTVRRLWLKDELDFLLKYWRRLHHSRICVGLNVTYEQARYAAQKRCGIHKAYSNSGQSLRSIPRSRAAIPARSLRDETESFTSITKYTVTPSLGRQCNQAMALRVF